MGAILCTEQVDERMAELTVALGHDDAAPDCSKQRLCARCGRPRGHGHRFCESCRPEAKKEYNQDYHRRHYRRRTPAEVSTARRIAVGQRWGQDA
jgi:predicted amidophosphoribosyltransferase